MNAHDAPSTGSPAACEQRSVDRSAPVLVERPALAWGYIAVLGVEISLLGGIVVFNSDAPPFTYPLGWAGVASMLVMQLYSLRRRIPALRRFGPLHAWLDAHIFLGLQGFVLVGYHSIGVSPNPSLAGINFALVSTVIVSGLIGRYLYGFIPRARYGAAIEHAALLEAIGSRKPPPLLDRPCRSLVDLLRVERARRRELRAVASSRLEPSERRISERAITLAARIAGLDVAERWFSRWTLFHRPLAYLLLGVTVLHVLAHYAYAP